MLYLAAILAGIGIGFLRGGRLPHLTRLRLRWPWLIFLSLLIQLLIFPLFSGEAVLLYATAPLHVLSYAILFVWLLMNLRVLPMRVLLLGATCNLIAVASNGGYMPASVTALERAGLGGLSEHLIGGNAVANVILMTPSTRVNAMGDWLYLPEWIPFSMAFSIGDLLIVAGLVWLIARGMVMDD